MSIGTIILAIVLNLFSGCLFIFRWRSLQHEIARYREETMKLKLLYEEESLRLARKQISDETIH